MMHVTFAELDQLLRGANSAVDAAEGHGCLCGALCASEDYSLERWVDEIVPDEPSALEGAGGEAMKLVYTDTRRALRAGEMEFTPLLPDDDVTLPTRADALASWCQGFLYGLGLSGMDTRAKLTPNVQEILQDLTHIGRASVDIEELDEESESAYAELVEYLRAGAQLIHDELIPTRKKELGVGS
jgi:uncharacterized protein